MIHSHDLIPTVAIAHARSFEGNGRFFENHAPLAQQLGERGVRAVALSGARDRQGGRSFGRYYDFDTDMNDMTLRESSITVDAAYDLTGGIARYTPEVAALNPLGVRDIVALKIRQYEVLRDLGDSVPYTVEATASKCAVSDALDMLATSEVVVKAERDYDKKRGVLLGTKSHVYAQLESFLGDMNPEKDTVVVQEYMPETTADFAAGIILSDAIERSIADERSGDRREIRAHVFDGAPVLITGRVGLDPEHKSPRDKWVFFDQDSVPAHVYELARTAATAIHNAGAASHSYMVVDLTPDGNRIGEVNGRMIGSMRANAERPAAQRAHEHITNELARTLTVMVTEKRQYETA